MLTRSGAEWMPSFIDLLQRKLTRITDPAVQAMVATGLIGALTALVHRLPERPTGSDPRAVHRLLRRDAAEPSVELLTATRRASRPRRAPAPLRCGGLARLGLGLPGPAGGCRARYPDWSPSRTRRCSSSDTIISPSACANSSAVARTNGAFHAAVTMQSSSSSLSPTRDATMAVHAAVARSRRRVGVGFANVVLGRGGAGAEQCHARRCRRDRAGPRTIFFTCLSP